MRSLIRLRASSVVLIALVATAMSFLGPGAAIAAQLTLTWTDNAGGSAVFEVERKTGTGGTYAQIATVTAATSYVDTAIAANTTYCYRVKASNAAGDSAPSNEACGTAAGAFDLTVAKAGTGAGMVSSSPAGISCGTDCFESFAAGTVVTLTATPAAGSVFSGWSGGVCSGTASCSTAGNSPVTIGATFSTSSPPVASYTLTVTKSGTGAGTVTSSPAGISCGADCSEVVTAGTTVTLTATPASGSTFAGWSGACGGTGSCTVAVGADKAVTAAFAATPSTTRYTLWTPTTTPSTLADADNNAVTLGVKVRTDVAGYATGVRFYKSTPNTGQHVGTLWTTTGTLLASVTFTNETASGWQEATFSSPVFMAANTTYIVAYHTTVGRYSADSGYFRGRTVNAGPLHAPKNSTAGGNGVYRYGSTPGFPDQTYNATNYWVDLVFQAR